MDRNQVWLIGYFENLPEFAFEFKGNKFFSGRISIQKGKATDVIPFVVGENVLKEVGTVESLDVGAMYEIDGEIRSRKGKDGRIEQYIQALRVTPSESTDFRNEIHICGQAKRPPKTRVSAKGTVITSLCLDVVRQNSDTRHDSILCTAFKQIGEIAESVVTGEVIGIDGRAAVFVSQSGTEVLEVHVSHIERERNENTVIEA